MNKITFPIGYYPDPTKGKPISGGSIYIGEPDTDPTVPGNQKTVTALQENGSEVSISQPILTSAGGVPLYNGSPVSLFVDGRYSMRINNSLGSQEYYIPDSDIDDTGVVSYFNTVADLKAASLIVGNIYKTKGYYASGDGGGATYLIKTSASYGGIPDEYIDHTLTSGDIAVLQYSESINIRQAGARSGSTYDNTDIIQAIHDILPNSGGEIRIPSVETSEPYADDGMFWCDSELVFTKAIKISGVDFTSSVLAYSGASVFITASVYGLTLDGVGILGTDGSGGEVYNPGSTGIKSEGVIYSILSRIAKFQYGIDYNGGFYHHFEANQMDRCKIIFNGFSANNLTIIGGRFYHCETVFSCASGVGPVNVTGAAFEFIQSKVVATSAGANFDVTFTGCYFENRPSDLTLSGIGGASDYYDSAQIITNGTGKVNLYGNFINTRGFTRVVNKSGEALSDIVSMGNHIYVFDSAPNNTLEYVFFLGTASNVFANDFKTGGIGTALYFSGRPDTGFASDPFLGTSIEFLEADADWTTPGSLLNGWTNDGGAGAADFGYYKDGLGFVHLRGRVDGGSSTSVTLAQLPSGYYPEYHHYAASVITNTGAIATIRVTLAGLVNVEFPATPNNVSLDNIIFKAV